MLHIVAVGPLNITITSIEIIKALLYYLIYLVISFERCIICIFEVNFLNATSHVHDT